MKISYTLPLALFLMTSLFSLGAQDSTARSQELVSGQAASETAASPADSTEESPSAENRSESEPAGRFGRGASLVLLSVAATRELRPLAENVRISLKVKLANSRVFKLMDEALARDYQSRYSSSREKPLPPKEARQLGREAGMDFVLLPRLEPMGDGFILTVDLIHVVSGRTQTHDAALRPSGNSRVLDGLVDNLVNGQVMMMNITLEDLETLIAAGDYEAAWDGLQTYDSLHSEEDPRRKDVEARIRKGLGDFYYQQALSLKARYLFNDALEVMGKALYYQPETPLYKTTVESLQRSLEELNAVEASEIARLIEAELEALRYDSAETLLEIYSARETDQDKILDFQDRIYKGRAEQELWEAGRRAFWARDYQKARSLILEASRMSPDKARYQELLNQIERHSRRVDASRLIWESYASSFRNTDWTELALVQKRFLPMPWAGVGSTTVTWRSITTLEENEYAGLAFSGGWVDDYLLPLEVPLDGATLGWGWLAGAALPSLGEKEIITKGSGSSILDKSYITDWEIFGTPFVTFNLFAFSLGTGPGLSLGIFSYGEVYRDPANDIDTQEDHVSFAADLDWDTSLRWRLSDEFFLGFLYRYSLARLVSPGIPDGEEVTRGQLSFFSGWRFF